MDLYLSACSKAASVAATKTATSSLAEDSQQCGDGVHKTRFPGIGAAELLNLPLGVKLPVIPGSNTLYYTTKLSDKLFQPSYGFNLTDPYCRLLENQYKSLHDPHLRAYHTRKDILRRLKKGGYITSNNKIVCNLRELNKYRQYLTSLKLDYERNYVREQKMLAKQLNKLQENNRIPGHSDVSQFQNWLLQEDTQSFKDQERLIRHRYLDMISRELEQREHEAEEQRLLQMDREERRQREQTRRKLSLRRKIEEEWKAKEMLLLTKIGEDLKREARVVERRRRSREESDKKKQALLEKKMAYHLQKLQENGFNREEMGKNSCDYRGHDGTHCESYPPKKKKIHDDIKTIYPLGDQKANKEPGTNVIHQLLSSSKNTVKKSTTPVVRQSSTQDNGSEQKKDGFMNKKSSIYNDGGTPYTSPQDSIISTQNSPTRNFSVPSPSYLGPTKVEKEINADGNKRQNKKLSLFCGSEPQAPTTTQDIFSSRVLSNTQQNFLQNCLQNKVTSEELNSIIQNIMTWVVATVTSILYPAITKYEERLQYNAYSVSEESVLSSDSSSFCSTCSEEFTYGSYTSATTKTFPKEPCAFAVDISVRRSPTPLKPPSARVERTVVEKTYHVTGSPSAHVERTIVEETYHMTGPPSARMERTVVGKTYHMKGQSITSELKCHKTSMIYAYPKLRSCKSDSYLLASFETGTKKSKDATTETDGLESPYLADRKAKAEIKNLEKIFVNFKCHLKGETELILESIFQEIMSDLTQAIPSISSVTAEVFVDQSEPEKRDSLSHVDTSSIASEIVENMLEKLQYAVEKKCVEMFTQEDSSPDTQPSLTPSEEYLTPSSGKPLKASLPYTMEPMCDIAEDMVHAILEKLVTLASYKQDELPHLEGANKLSYQQHMTDPTCMVFKKTDKRICSPEPDAANLIVKEEIQNLISNIFSQSSLVAYIEEAISTILGYVQTELNNERLIASEETVVFLQLLNDIFTELHQKPIKADVPKSRPSRLRNLSDTSDMEEKYRLTGTRLSSDPRSRKQFPPINVPGMVLYSEDDNEEIDKIVKNVLDSSIKDEKAKSEEENPEYWFTKGNTCFEHKRNRKTPTKPNSLKSKVAFCEGGLKTELPCFNNKEILEKTSCLNKDILIFSQDQKRQIQKASQNVVLSILTELVKELSSVPPSHLGIKTGKETSVLVSEKPQGLSLQEWIEQMFSLSEINTVAQEITEAVLNILHKASSCIPNSTKSSISPSVNQTSPDSSDTPNMVKETPSRKPLKIWFDSEKKMKYLSSLDLDPAKPPLLKSEENELKPVEDITDDIINAVFKNLKLLIYPKLQMGFQPSLAEQSSLHSQLSTYTAKVVNIVLRAIQNELELSKKNLNLRDTDYTKSLTGQEFCADNANLESLVSSFNDDIMASPLLACICEMLLSSEHSNQTSISLPSDKPRPSISYGSDNVEKQNTLLSRQDKNSFRQYLATPCALHSDFNGRDLKENARLQVLDSIGEALFEMLCKLLGEHPDCQLSCSKLNREKMNEKQQTTTKLQSNIQLISKTILEYILAKLCSVDMDTSFASSGIKAASESLDIDSLSFDSIIEEMSKCTDIIASIVSRMVQESNKNVTEKEPKAIASVSSKTGSTKETQPNKLKAMASDILNTVFAKLEGFASGNLETQDSITDGNEKISKMDLTCESPSVFTDTHKELLQSMLYLYAKKASSTILKAIQTELNLNSLDLRTSVKTSPPENQILKNIVNLILDAVSSDMFNETESEERDIETFRYKPTYGNFLPGGAESDSFLEDSAHREKEFTGEKTSLREDTKSDSFKQWILQRTLNKIEVKLKEPLKSPLFPIIRNILNEIFQGALASQLSGLSFSRSHLDGIPHNAGEPIAQASVPFTDKTMDPLVSEADVLIVVDDVVRTVFHKLYSVAMTQRNASENRYKTITFSANVSFHKHSYGGKSSVTVLDKNPCALQSRANADKQVKVNVAEDIVQAILTNLETFATSKVKSLFCPQINFTVPLALPVQQDKRTLSQVLSTKDSYSNDQFSCCTVGHIMSEKTSSCQLSLNKLNTHATEVATKILQGIKYELDKEKESPFLTHNIMVSEGIASQIVNTVLDIVSSKSKCDKNNSDKGLNSGQQEGIIEKMFNKTEYRNILQFQIQDTIECVLCDIYEKTLYQNNLSFAMPTLKCSIAGKHSEANSEMQMQGVNKIIPKLAVPKSDVILISNDIVNIVLHNLSRAVMLGIKTEDPTSARLPLAFCDMFAQAECQPPPFMGSKSERKTGRFSSSRNLKAYAVDSHIAVLEEEDAKKPAPDPCEENANFITTTIFKQLESFATKRIDALIALAFQPKEKSFVSPELENCKQGDSIFHESSQTQSNVNVLKIPTGTILSQELTDSALASYREKLGSTIPLSQASLKEYADFIASVILKLIKNDLDLEIQKAYLYPSNNSFQENIIVSDIVNSILKFLNDKRSVKEISFYSKDNSNLLSQLALPNEILLEQREQEENTKLSLFSQYPLEQNQMTLEKESQRIVLEEIFMRNGESKQKEKTALLNAVEEDLNKAYQGILEIKGHLPPFNEPPYFVSNSKFKTSDITQKNFFQLHINSVANDIIEIVLGEMYSVVVSSLYESNKKEEASDSNDTLSKQSLCATEPKQAGKGSDSIRYGAQQVYASTGNENVSLLERSSLQYSPLQVGKDLVQMVLHKITNFASFHLREASYSEGCSEELQPLSAQSFKVSPKCSPQSGLKKNLRIKSKVTPLPKFRTKPHLGSSSIKSKSKTKLGPGEKTPKYSQSKTATGRPHVVTAGDAKSLLETKLPTSELKMYTKHIISNILEKTVQEFEKVKHTRAVINVKALPCNEIMAASKIVNTVLQGLYATNHRSLAHPIRFSHLDDLQHSQGNIGTGSLAKTQACFSLENVSSQLEQIFPKDGIFKKMFDKWQAESNDMEREKCNLLMVAENVLTAISIKAKELEYSLSLLNLPHLEDCESKFHSCFKRTFTRAEDTTAQINMFGREIVEMLFEKLQLCFLSQMPTLDSKETPTSRKCVFPTKDSLSSAPIYNMNTEDQTSLGYSKQIVQEIVERVLNMLESFVDLQFKYISKYEFSEIVKMPIENVFPVQQRLLSKNMLPKLQPLKKFSDDSKSSTIISQENVQNTLLRVHSFHSELLTYAVNIISDMLGIIKNELDKETTQIEPSSISILNENIVASDIIGTLIDQCTYFKESLIKNLPVESLFPGVENTYIVNQVELATNMKIPNSKLKQVSFVNNPPQISVPGLVFHSEEDMKKNYRTSSNLFSYIRASTKDPIKSSEPLERPDSKNTPTCLRNNVQDCGTREWPFDQATTGNRSLPEGSVLQKLCKKVNESTEKSLKQGMSFIEMGKGRNPQVFHYEAINPVVEPNQTQSAVSPLKICLAAENIVNTVLSSYGFPSQPPGNESMETMKPFFISKQNLGEQKNEKKSLLGMWDKRISCIPEEQHKNSEATRGDFSLLQKWENIKYPKTLKEFEVIAFADHELGPNEINLVARHVTTSVVTYFQNFKTRVPSEKMPTVSTLSRKKYKSKQPLRSIYSDSSLYQFCEHLTESVICHLILSISDSTKDYREKEKAWESQNEGFNKIILIYSQVFENRSISIGELSLSISEIITKTLFNSNIIEADIEQQMCPLKTKYIYCPGIAAIDFDNLFQDLLIGVTHALSKEIGISHHFESNRKNKSFSVLGSNSVPICNKANTMKRQLGCREWESSTQQNDHLIQKNKLNYLAHKLDRLVSNLETCESKEVVNKVFNIVLDLFSPDEHPGDALGSDNKARNFSSSSNDQQNDSLLGNNLSLTPNSVFLLNVVCEKLIRALLEKCTSTVFLDNGSLSDEIAAEACQLSKILQSVEEEESDYCKGAMDYEQFQGNHMSDLWEQLAKKDQDLLSSDSMLTIISHSLVKSLMDKLCKGTQLPLTPPTANNHLKYRTREIQLRFVKAKRPELAELGQDTGSLGFMNYDSNALTGSLNNPSKVSSTIQAPFGKKFSVNSPSVSPFKRQGTKAVDPIAIHNKLNLGDMHTGVYSATFLEEIISELFFNLSTSLWGKNESITETQLNEMNTLFVTSVVNEFNNAHVTVLRNAEERLCFPPVHKETVHRIADSVYYDVLQKYKLKVSGSSNLAHDNTSIAEQITNGILLEILDYRLPPYVRKKFMPNSYHPLKAEIILQKLQNNLSEFTSKSRSPTCYSTRLSHSFLEDVTRRLLSQLIAPLSKASYLGEKCFMSSDFNEMSNCIINKVISAISKHKIWFTMYDNQHLCTGKNLQKMVDSVYSNIMQTSDSLVSIQKSVISRSPAMVDRIASFIIQEVIENHLQPFLCEEVLPRPNTPLDAISNMVKQVLSEVIESHGPKTPSPIGMYPDIFIREIVARLLSKIFSPKHNTEIEVENITQKIVNSINSHLDKAKIPILCNDKEQSYPSVDTDIVDELVTSVYRNVLKKHGLDPEFDEESKKSDIFVANITNLIVAAISDCLLHPLFSGDLSLPSCPISTAENIIQDIISNTNKSTKPSQSSPPYSTLLPYRFVEEITRGLLSRVFHPASNTALGTETLRGRSKVSFNEIASNIINDIRMKISQHEIHFLKDEEETKFVYSENDVQHLVDSVFKNISQNSEFQESVEQNITGSDDVLIDRIAGFIIKYICQRHLQPFLDKKSLPSSSYTYLDNETRQWFYASVYSSTFLEDVVSGVLYKIFHRVLGIVQTKSVRDSEDELFDKAETLIHLIAEEFSKAQVRIIENAEEQLCVPPVERNVVKIIIDVVFGKVLQEYDMEIRPKNDFLNDAKTLAAKITKMILAETSDFQIHPNIIRKLPFQSFSKLDVNGLIKRVQCDITKSRLQRRASTIYTTKLSHTHLEKIVTQLISQVSPLASSAECINTSQSDLSNAVIKLINEIISIISKHAICITKHGNIKQSMISEKDIQSMVDSIYADLSYSNLYQSLTKDKKDISNIPVSKIASFIIKEIFNHHLQSSSGDKTFISASFDQNDKQKVIDPKQRELSFIVNSAVFLEEVISELLCKLLYAFSHNVLAAENPDTLKVKITDIVTTLVKSIILEFTTSEILVADYFDNDMCFSEEYKEMVQKTVNRIYEKILDKYKSLIQVYRTIQSDTVCFGRKIYHLLLEEIYDYQVESLVSGELVSSPYTSPKADNIIRRVLNVILKDSYAFPSCVTVLPRSLLEDIIYKLLVHFFPPTDIESELKEEDVSSDYEFVDAASKLTDEIIREISEHEIHIATAEESAENTQLEVIENLVDSICNDILKKSEFQAEVQKDADKKRGSILSKIAGFVMKGIMDHHLRPFLHGAEPSGGDYDHVSVLAEPGEEKTRASLYSATFLEDVIVDLVRKFYSLPSITKDLEEKEMPETGIVGVAIKFANSLIGEFRKNEIKVLPNAEKMFAFPPIDKKTVDKISNFVYDQFIGKYESNEFQKDDKSNSVIEIIADLAQKAMSAFKIQPLFSGDWSSTFSSFLNPKNITQRVQHLPQKTSTQNRCVKGNQLTFSEQPYKHTSPTSNQKNLLDTLEINRSKKSRKKSFQTEETSIKKDDIQDPKANSVTRTMKDNTVNLCSGSAAGVTNKKKENENKVTTSIKKYTGNVSKVTSPTTSVKSKDTWKPDLGVTLKNDETEKKRESASKDKERQGNEVHTQILAAPADTVSKEEIRGPDFETNNEKKIGKTRENLFKKEEKPFHLSSTSKAGNAGTRTETTEKRVTEKPNIEETKDIPPLTDINEKHYSGYETVQNITENIYDDILEAGFSQESGDYSNLQSPSSDTFSVIQEVRKDFAQSISIKDLSLSTNENLPAKEHEKEKERERESEREKKLEKEKERVKVKVVENESSKPDSPQGPPKKKPGIFPANFLEDVIIEMINKLIFSTSPETQAHDRYRNVGDGQNQAELYDAAMKLIDSLLKEFSEAQIKVFRPNTENQFFPPVAKVSSVSEAPPKHKESTIDETSSNMKKITVDKMSHTHKVTKKIPLNNIPFLDRIPAVDKTLVNKVVHSSVCSILKEYRSQDSICKNIKSNGKNLARRLTSAVINEICEEQLNLIFCDEIPASACLPLESKDIVKRVQKAAQTASKECQTSSPYTIMLPQEFLGNVVSALLSKIFSIVSKTKAETSEGNWLTELDFLQMKLLSTVTTEISKDEDVIIQYVESLHPNDDEIIQLVVHSIYNNLLSQFGSQKVIQNCVASGCRILSETIVDLVLREVAGNQLQNYFSGELTPHQCAEVDSIVENILKDVMQTTDAPQPRPPHAHVLPYDIIEEIAVKFLSKLLCMFPKVEKERNKSLATEMQNIAAKILNSIQEFISESKIKFIPPAKEMPTVTVADNATIERVVNSVYTSVLNHSGSHTSIFKDLMGKSNVLSNIIGFLVVKEISNSEFQSQVKGEVSSSESVLEAIKIMEKVVKIVDEFKSQEKSSSEKGSTLNAAFLKEALALFLAKIIRLPSASSQDAKTLSKSELNKIASQLTKSVTAEISKNDISLVAADPEEESLNPESVEMISQVIDSVYSNVLHQSGTHKDLYYDIKSRNRVFPKKVASLIINEVSNFPVDTDDSKNSNADLFGDLDVNKIVEKAQEHALRMIPDLEKEESDQGSITEEMPIKIVPHIGNRPVKVDPGIISDHLAVISIKTQPLEKLQMECLRNTGHSIAEVRRASIDGRAYSLSDTAKVRRMKKERRTSLSNTGRLNVKPLEIVCRNSFQNIRKPDITKVELLKDVQNKKDLLIRLVAHDIEDHSKNDTKEDPISDEYEVVLREVIQEEYLGEQFENQVKETSTTNTESTETTSDHLMGCKERGIERYVTELDTSTCSTPMSIADSSWEQKPRHKEEKITIAEPTHYFIHRIMSSSSYNQEDLISSSSDTEDGTPDTPAKIVEETPKSSISKQGSKMLAKVSSALSKVFSRTNSVVSKSASPPPQGKR